LSGYYDAYYLKAQVRALIARDFDEAFRQVDAVNAPVSPFPPSSARRSTTRSTCTSDIYMIDRSRNTRMSVPCGRLPRTPVGMQSWRIIPGTGHKSP
jgi:aspartyl-tRNA(Asn)/glutamyl-tRNA(Gln) amidotransferase subunit A